MRKAPQRGLGHALPVVADFNSLHMPPASFSSRSMILDLAASVEPFKFSPAEPVAYEGSHHTPAVNHPLFLSVANGSRYGPEPILLIGHCQSIDGILSYQNQATKV